MNTNWDHCYLPRIFNPVTITHFPILPHLHLPPQKNRNPKSLALLPQRSAIQRSFLPSSLRHQPRLSGRAYWVGVCASCRRATHLGSDRKPGARRPSGTGRRKASARTRCRRSGRHCRRPRQRARPPGSPEDRRSGDRRRSRSPPYSSHPSSTRARCSSSGLAGRRPLWIAFGRYLSFQCIALVFFFFILG